jgi:hypothetical protein
LLRGQRNRAAIQKLTGEGPRGKCHTNGTKGLVSDPIHLAANLPRYKNWARLIFPSGPSLVPQGGQEQRLKRMLEQSVPTGTGAILGSTFGTASESLCLVTHSGVAAKQEVT